jgi:hypothetical protein
MQFDLTVVPTGQVPSLKLVVQDEDVILPGRVTDLPIYGEPILHPVVTQGR